MTPVPDTPPPLARPTWSTRADALATLAAVALAFTLPLSTAAANICLGVMLLAWLSSGRWQPAMRASVASAPAALALALLAWLLISALWTSAPAADAMDFARKYADLALVGLFAYLLRDPRARARVLAAFAAAMLLTLALSYAAAAGLLPPMRWLKAMPGNPVVFKMHITHALLMSLGALLFAHRALQADRTGARIAWAAASALAAINVVLMVDGRIGYLVLAGFVLLVARLRAGWPGFALALLAVLAGAVTAYHGSDNLRARVDLALAEARDWSPDRPARLNDSIGSRLEFYTNSAALVREKPFAGFGLGAFPTAYEAQGAGSGRVAPRHPHNEFLLLAVQAGLPAAAIFAWLLVRLYGGGFGARPGGPALARDTPVEAVLAPALAVWMGIGCVFNALLIDHTESLLFALLAGLVCAGRGSRAGDSIPSAPPGWRTR